jgi:hypothetical protein
LPLGIGAVVVLQWLFTYAQSFQVLFDTESIPLRIWPKLILGGFIFFLVVELEKGIIRTTRSSRRVPVAQSSSA